ncbi:F-box protein At5g03970 [Carica papaya]|uniref:F-box protein At5g03970 n=1 Tax=Carica papaya TaxID=3649 RepID=UPI000B8CA886|nr:F-box protein At5g03970 [Carica papaya]XP_021888672.1 F-box protein At5g03970 [Carica papaya]XP_021888673.1 F-box protein At5g03970 [Carica papaya]
MMSARVTQSSVHAALSSDDIMCDILIRLPPESVFKLILVSKRWLRLICGPYFRYIYLSRWKTSFHLLGFFVCNSLYLGRREDGLRRPRSEPALPLLSTCKEGDDLKYSGILKQLGYFIDSSKGILLCGRHPKTYYVWNPTKEKQYQLPRPRVYFEELCMAFIVEDCPDDDMCYKVIRAKCECRLEEVNTVTIETFFSKTTTWSYSTLTCSSNLCLSPWTVGTVIGGVVHWHAAQGHVAIYDPDNEEKRIALIKLPGSYDYDEHVLGESSDGLLQYGWSNTSGMEIWVLEKEQDSYSSIFSGDNNPTVRWNRRYKLNFKTMWKNNLSIATKFSTRSKETQILSFVIQNSDAVFIRSGSNIFLYYFESKRVEYVPYQGRGSSILWDFCKVVPYFKRAWPHFSTCREGQKIPEQLHKKSVASTSGSWGQW